MIWLIYGYSMVILCLLYGYTITQRGDLGESEGNGKGGKKG